MYWLGAVLFIIGIAVYMYSVSSEVKVASGCNSCPKNNANLSM